MNSMFFENIRLILIYPNKAWDSFAKINLSFTRFFLQIVLPVIIIYGLCVFVGQSLSTLSTASISYVSVFSVFVTAIYLLAFYVSTIILRALIPLFGGINPGIYAALLIFYSAIPFYLSQMITGLFPSLIFIKLFSFYSFYLFYIGCEKLIKPDKDRQIAFYLVSILTVIGVHLLLYFAVILPVFNLL
jgi:hypothetical protein